MSGGGRYPIAEAALALWERGFHVIPLGSPGEDIPDWFIKECGSEEAAAEKWPKKPLVSWLDFQQRAPTEDEVRGWWQRWPQANIGIITGINVHVVDADTDEAAQWVEENLTRTPWKVRTGRGVQYYYRATDLEIRNTANPQAKLDTRGVGGYVVAPPSIHSTGVEYEWVVDQAYSATTPDELPALSTDDVEKLKHPAGLVDSDPVPKVVWGADGSFSIDARNVPMPGSGVSDAPVAEGGRNVHASRLAGKYINDGHTLREVKQLLDQWNGQNPTPLSDHELNRTIASVARTHARNNPDKPLPIDLPPPETPAEAPSGRGQSTDEAPLLPFTVMSMGELIDRPPKKPEFLWNGATLFRGARMLIAAEPKAGKTRFAMSLARALATGGEFLGLEVERPVKILYFNAEVHEAWLVERTRPLIHGTAPEHLPALREHFVITGRLSLDLLNRVDNWHVRRLMAEHSPVVTIMDPAIDLSSVNENDNTEVRGLLRELDSLAHDFNTAMVVIHHTRKVASAAKFKEGPFDRIRGASAYRGWYDTGIVLTPTGHAGEVTVAYELRNGESPRAHNICWSEEVGDFVESVQCSQEVHGGEEQEPQKPVFVQAADEGQTVHEGRAKIMLSHMQTGRVYEREQLWSHIEKREPGLSDPVKKRAFAALYAMPEVDRKGPQSNYQYFLVAGAENINPEVGE